MKKVFLLVASALLATSAFAQLGFLEGKAANSVPTPGNSGKASVTPAGTVIWSTETPKANERFTYAITVTEPVVLNWLNGGEGRTLALGDFRTATDEAVGKTDIRLVKVGSSNTYAIDLSIDQIFADYASAEPVKKTLDFAGVGGIEYIHFQLTGADITGSSTWEHNLFGYGNFGVVAAVGTDAPYFEWVEDEAPAENYDVPGGVAKPTFTTGIGDITADGKVIEGYYTILGVKLTDEPANGIFIEKYTDGTSAKIVK